jgi:hypothetical protein
VAVFLMEQRGHRIAQVEKAHGLEIDIVDDPSLRRQERRLKVARTAEDVTEQVTV